MLDQKGNTALPKEGLALLTAAKLSEGSYHENNNEDKANSHDDKEGDQVVFQGEAEIRHEDHMSPTKTNKHKTGNKCSLDEHHTDSTDLSSFIMSQIYLQASSQEGDTF